MALAAWIPGSMTTLALATAPITSALCQKYNCRYVTACGAILSACGIIASSFARTIQVTFYRSIFICICFNNPGKNSKGKIIILHFQDLFLTFGVLTGIGVGLSTTPGVILTARYFDKRRGIANAFCLSGTAAGSFILPFLIEYLLDGYGFRGTMLILGACMLHILVSSALYRPLATHVNILRRKRLGYVHTVEEDCIDDKKPCSYPGRSHNSNTQDALPIHVSQW